MIESIISLALLGIIFGAALAFASIKFAVEEDPKAEAIKDVLPGANCGACGLAGCSTFAEKVVSGEADVAACIPGGADVAGDIADIMGMPKPEEGVSYIAQVKCVGFGDTAKDSFVYDGVPNCTAASEFFGGFKDCQYGCLGLGTCAQVCPFDAITMENDKPVVDPELCKACNKCVELCPRSVISLVTYNPKAYAVLCNSRDKGKQTKAFCQVGCIGCGACFKVCEDEAVTMEKGKLATIDPEKCTSCAKCVEKCPRPIIFGPS